MVIASMDTVLDTVFHSDQPGNDIDATTSDEIINPRNSGSSSQRTLTTVSPVAINTPDGSPVSPYATDDNDEMPGPSTSKNPGTRWTARLLPALMLGLVGYATYDVIVYCCVEHFLRKEGKTVAAIVLIVLYTIFFILMVASYIRAYTTIQFNAGFVPWTTDRETIEAEREKRKENGGDIEALPWTTPDTDPDSPGLEAFYSKDVFICEVDGLPKWCSECRNWKPDRAHHSSEYGRCVFKMDHVCPWMGGVVSETSTNGYTLDLRQRAGENVDARLIVGLAAGGLFGLFSVTMSCTALKFVFQNITNVDMLKKNQTFRLAVRVPNGTHPTEQFTTITYPLSPPAAPESVSLNGNGQVDSAPPRATNPMTARDEQAKRTFAILKTEPGENPWHVGHRNNFKTVMGNSFIDWLLPIRHSPCCSHDSMVSDYEFGSLVEELKRRYGLAEGDPEKAATETISN
ncbi:palmitoyltransferase pfa5 [Fusarium torreyae]|uniref:Palmitoyltransferase n=1 Tax=Fusarium torreyae TaxID=1237075 RepID=A0A9W8VDK1_9HYPO|nr:palmitoyltransferase pfa5 [Fusarium torreyae]